MNCANCSAPIRAGKPYLYDDHSEQSFCDDGCLRDWADSHFDVVLAQYRRLNIIEETG